MSGNNTINITGRYAWGAAVAAALIASAGCGKGPDTVQVRGNVTFQGKPVSEGTVTFQPVEIAEGLPKRPAVGALQPDGTYQLASFGPNDGAVPGKYKVLIISFTGGPSPERPNNREIWAVPKKYGNAQSSDLSATIPADADGPMELNFDLQE